MKHKTFPAQFVCSILCLLEALVPVRHPSLASVNLTLNKCLKVADSISTIAAERKWYHRIIHQYPNTQFRLIVSLVTFQPFDDHSSGKRSQFRCIPGSSFVRLCGIHDRSRGRLVLSIVKESQCRIHSHHEIIVREVCVNGTVEREKLRI